MHTQSSSTKTTKIAYFCAEFALSGDLPIYAGGLGILAGDVVREAYDLKLPMVAVGLLYQTGYHTGNMISDHPNLVAVPDPKTGAQLELKIPIQDGIVGFKVWEWKDHTIPVYLLDTRVASNSVEDTAILHRLYADNRETRLKQQMILGVGGKRVLDRLGIEPEVYHLNEGHSGVLAVELISAEMKKHQVGFEEAISKAKEHIVFTNHTLVAAGNELYPTELVAMLFRGYALELGLPNTQLVELGQVPQSTSFSMTTLCLRMSSKVNAVSKLHAEKAKTMWADYPMQGITNGIHLPTWDYCHSLNSMINVPAGTFWQLHQARKKELLTFLKMQKSSLDWSTDDLIIGWARRIVPYKQPLLLFEQFDALKKILHSTKRKVRFVLGGRVHPSDNEGQELLNKLRSICNELLPEHCMFVENYSISTSPIMLSGCDIWLNTPIVGYEACGTSGMKAALNGALPLSTNDGWIFEANLTGKGWLIQDVNSAESLLHLLTDEIVPLFDRRNEQDVPEKWEEYMFAARQMVQTHFSGTRMLEDYQKILYHLPLS